MRTDGALDLTNRLKFVEGHCFDGDNALDCWRQG